MDSRKYPGVQIADIWASALAYAFNHAKENISRQWLELAENVTGNVITPDAGLIDLRKGGPFINTTVLLELSQRSVESEDLFLGMDELVLNAASELSGRLADWG